MSENKPNVLLINVDQWGGNFLSCKGSFIKTPTLDSMCKIGTLFANAYSSTPVCIPARREILCGCNSRKHGDRTFDVYKKMPEDCVTIAEAFHNAGYQTFASGKLHVYPQRSRAGFDDVYLMEEGRHYDGMKFDDYERFLLLNGHAGEEYGHCMCNNDYLVSPWHLDEKYHPTNWITRQMCECIMRRDPNRPAFWYVSYNHPHPPLAPLQKFLDMYDNVDIPMPPVGEWTKDKKDAPKVCLNYWNLYDHMKDPESIKIAMKGYAALCTHIDYQIRMLLGTIREQGIIDNTIIAFVSDHGEMLGTHNLWQKNMFYENSTKIPFIIVPQTSSNKIKQNYQDNRLVELRDLMPTLLDLAGIDIPSSVNGMSLLHSEPLNNREYIYGELWEDIRTTRMIRNERYKLIYSPFGNKFQLFDLEDDVNECHDLSNEKEFFPILEEMKKKLISELYGSDLSLINEQGVLIGTVDSNVDNGNVLGGHDFLLQRGYR